MKELNICSKSVVLAIAWCGLISGASAADSAVAADVQHHQLINKQKVTARHQPQFNVAPEQINGRRLVGKIQIPAGQNLQAGDVVTLKLFNRQGNPLAEKVKVVVKQPYQEKEKSWSYQLASEINHNLAGIRAGQQTELGIILPSQTGNYVYASADSVVHRIETQVQKPGTGSGEESDFSVTNLDSTIPFNESGTHVTFDVNSSSRGFVTAKLYNEKNLASGSFQQELNPGNQNMSLRILQPGVGKYRLQLTFKSADGVLSEQQHTITVTDGGTDV